jgi:hypothetical protein
MLGAKFFEPVDHVAEKFVVTALVRTNRYAVCVFLYCRAHDVVNAAVVSQVDDLGSPGLDQAPHDIDRSVMSVEQGRRCDESQGRVLGLAATIRYAWQIAGCSTHGVSSSDRNAQENAEKPGVFLYESSTSVFQKVLI